MGQSSRRGGIGARTKNRPAPRYAQTMTHARRALVPILIAFTLSLPGCGQNPIRDRARAVEVAGHVLETASEALELAAFVDASESCPDAGDECLEAVQARWEPVDAAIDLAVDALRAWLAGGTGASFASAWSSLVRVARAFLETSRSCRY